MIADRGLRIGDCWCHILGLTLIFAGCFGPWVDHKTAALTVTGIELAEFAKFFPEVQGGTVDIKRPLFYCPFIAALLLSAYLAGRSYLRPVRLLTPVLVASLLVIAVLPYSVVEGVRHALAARSAPVLDPDYTGQLALVVVGIGLALMAPLANRLSPRAQGVVVGLAVLAGIIPALWQFVVLYPLVVALYDAPLAPGWGMIVCVIGFALPLFSGVRAAVKGAI